ncbi:MAG: sulfite exporter TauE/SafE family protein [Rhodospirillaceae bacterium]|jgi:uncharacterized protein|nr:sulfite exporter TauE/SafE family protein [Rhodospirillaceae bacterium]MBT4042884.1 sulfite exporter TauE/SafE family protein [Rhodospirillaceae bacterium]MBT4686675.1 sulfite exporter TauE/SafE family protein [Rhodospirillaceae bacterium]MBT5082261.1 sulfite exporter TauE/SafE family protein [Rhodospirillaceae bacterium]MBT5526780.1 sulfite exporter TauE/SafE family protein [Rhodospirillaceae bacterium]
MFDIAVLLPVIATFFLAGTVKGVIGLGLPSVSLAILTVIIDLPTAMALLLVPSFVTNVWQAMVGGQGPGFGAIVRRLWPFLAVATLTVWLGAKGLAWFDLSLLSMLLGVLLAIYAGVSLLGLRFEISKRQEVWLGPVLGLANGLLTGLTGSFVVPGVMFLQSIGLPRDGLIQAMGILFTASTVALGIALGGNDLLSKELGLTSLAALPPALIGMAFGQRIRQKLPEQLFRRVFFIALLVLGGYIILRHGL